MLPSRSRRYRRKPPLRRRRSCFVTHYLLPPHRRYLLTRTSQLDIDVGENYPDSDYFGPWRFSHPYSDGDACWVDSRRGWVHDGTCGNLLDLDTDILLSKRFYKDDPYYIDGVPCVKDGKEGVITDYICVVVSPPNHTLSCVELR